MCIYLTASKQQLEKRGGKAPENEWLLLQWCQRIGRISYELIKTKPSCFLSSQMKWLIFLYQKASNCMQQVELMSSTVLLNQVWHILLHVSKRRLTLLHVADAVRKGCKITMRTVDTDVFVVVVDSLSKMAHDELWIALAVGWSFRYIVVHEIAECLNLPGFHAFTGCDIVSSFAGRGKKTAWEMWKSFPMQR